MAGSNHLVLVPMHDYITLYRLVGRGHFTALILLAGNLGSIQKLNIFRISTSIAN